VAALLLVGIAAFAAAPRAQPAPRDRAGAAVTYAQVEPIVTQRCAVCHAARPRQPGFAAPPLGILLDTPEHVRTNAKLAYQQAVATHAMPLGNITHMTDAERAKLGAWITAGAKP
jgi:uncharacterized membrane protein